MSAADQHTARLAAAYLLAARAHAGQTRKGPDGVPYIVHPCEVADLVARHGADPETVMAAVLHDVVEDSDVTTRQIEAEFGPRVADLVDALTDRPDWAGLDRAAHKALQAQHIARADPEAQRIKIADQTSNMRDISRVPQAWRAENAAGRIAGAAQVVDACRARHPDLAAAFDAAADEARRSVGLPE